MFSYVAAYFRSVPLRILLRCTLFIAVTIFCNYYFGVNSFIRKLPDVQQGFAWFFVFFTVFLSGYLFQDAFQENKLFQKPIFFFLLFVAPLLFAWKMTARFTFQFFADLETNSYWNQVVYWPLKLTVILVALLLIWYNYNKEQPFYGTTMKGFDVKPYFIMLLLMLPLILLAATQADFLALYPKLKNSGFLVHDGAWYYKLLYELSYGMDFITIEVFFRGFLVLGFAKWAGKEAVLPMALFYCTIHFGKPLGECISSYFGGLILGAITLRTRSIWGGLIVHLGIAWLMELFGFLGNSGVL